MQSWMTKYLPFFNLENGENGLFSLIFFLYSGMDDCKSSDYIWKNSTIVLCNCHTKHQFQHSKCNFMVRWQTLFNPDIHWWHCWSQKICRNSEMAKSQIWINSSDIQIWWNGCECGLFVFNRRSWEQKKVVNSTRQVWMLV